MKMGPGPKTITWNRDQELHSSRRALESGNIWKR